MSIIKNLLPILLALALIGTIAYAVVNQYLYVNTGTIVVTVDVAAYTDNSLETLVTTLAWGDIEPGQNLTRLIYLNSTSNVPVTLSMDTVDWSSTEAQDTLTLIWDLEAQNITAGDILEATLTLSADADVEEITPFIFTTIIHSES